MTPITLLLTRPRHTAEAFASSLDSKSVAQVNVVISPLMEIAQTGIAPEHSVNAGAIFTSANGVEFAPDGQGRRAYCVGLRTTEAATMRGWDAEQVGETATELTNALTKIRPCAPLLHMGGTHTRGDVAQTLSQAGIETRHIALYTQRLLPMEVQAKAALGGPCIVPVFSPRSAEQLQRVAHGMLEQAHIVALSPAVAAPLRGENMAQLNILPRPQALYMRKAVENLCLTLSLP